jgi:hypothetical protein
VIIHGKTGCQKKTMLRQKEVTEYGQWLKAPSPPRRHDRGASRNGPKRETSYSYHERREGAHPSTTAGGGHAKTAAGSFEEPIPNPRRAKSQKEKSGELGENRGVVEKYLAKMQNVTENQAESQFGRYDSSSKELNGSNSKRPSGVHPLLTWRGPRQSKKKNFEFSGDEKRVGPLLGFIFPPSRSLLSQSRQQTAPAPAHFSHSHGNERHPAPPSATPTHGHSSKSGDVVHRTPPAGPHRQLPPDPTASHPPATTHKHHRLRPPLRRPISRSDDQTAC